MALMTVISGAQAAPQLKPGILMIHKEEPPMVVVVDEVTAAGEGFWGTDLETGIRIEYATEQFNPFIGKLTLEQ
jgi:hypothetical protein